MVKAAHKALILSLAVISAASSQVMAFDGWTQQDNGKWTYYQNDAMLKNTWSLIDGKWYHFDKKGSSQRSEWYKDADENRYYFDENGAMKQNEWFSVVTTKTDAAGNEKSTENWYYAGDSGAVYKNGKFEIDGRTYLFGSNGQNVRNSFKTENTHKRYYGEDGAMKQNEWFRIVTSSTVKGPETALISEEERVKETENWYYADGNGYIVTRSVMNEDGAEYRTGKNGAMLKGWQKDKLGDYTFYGDDGAKKYGWIQYQIPKAWLTDKNYVDYVNEFGDTAWFYLDPNDGGKAARCRANSFGEVVVEGRTYAMNKRGMMWTGWCPTLYKNESGMRRYRYYMPESRDGLVQGEKAVNTAIFSAPPAGVSLGTEKTWYYFDGNGDYIRAEKGKTELKLVGSGRHVAVDEYGITKSGLGYSGDPKHPIQEVYYCDPDDRNALFTGFKLITLPDGRQEWYAFGTGGKGVSGVKDEYLYYRGRLQTGSYTRIVEIVTNEHEDASEKIMAYIVDSGGKVLTDISTTNLPRERAKGPEEKDFSFFIGETEK